MCMCTPEIKTPFCGKPGCEWPAITYTDDDGNPRNERRRKSRSREDERIGHLFEGFDNVIRNADGYTKGYVEAMRIEFAQLVTSLDR